MTVKLFIVSIIGLSLAMFAAYVLMNGESSECDDALRVSKPTEKFVKTLDGVTHYEMLGKDDAQTVVLVHGVSGPMKVWNKTVSDLTSKGLRVLRYDLYGRGLSDRLKADYDEQLYDRQLFELLKVLSIQTPVILVGSSMGAIISAGFANRHPELVKNVVLIGPAGFQIQASPLSKLMYLPWIGEYIMGVFGSKNLIAHHWKYFFHPERFPEMHAAFAEQLTYRKTKTAILSTMRYMPVQDFRNGYEQLGTSNKAVLLLWGKHDVTFPFANHEKATKYIPQAKFVAIENAAHLPQYENAESVSSEILSFIGKEEGTR